VARAVSRSISVFKNRAFARFARKARIADADLWNAARLADEGLIDADLGGGVIKLRIARRGEGKSGGSRSIVVFRKTNRAVFVHGFEKKDVSNIGTKDLESFRKLAVLILGFSDAEIAQRVHAGSLIPVESGKGEEHG
jgi:hypothetical protein